MSTVTTEDELLKIRRQRILEKAKRYREKKKLEGKTTPKALGPEWRYSISTVVKKEFHAARIQLYRWFMFQTQEAGSVIQRKIQSTPSFHETYTIVDSRRTKEPVIRRVGETRTLDTYDCQKLNQEIKELLEEWLKTDPEFYESMMSDPGFTSQFKVNQRAVKKSSTE